MSFEDATEWMLDPRARRGVSAGPGHESATASLWGLAADEGECCGPCADDRDCGSDDVRDVGTPGESTFDLAPDKPVPVIDWDLLRKFNTFWPRHAQSPPTVPWIGHLVTRKKAWMWVSQFPRELKNVDSDDTQLIVSFVARSLTEVVPSLPMKDDGDEKEKKPCCKRDTYTYPEVFPEDFPEDDCYTVTCACDEHDESAGWQECCETICHSTGRQGDCLPCSYG